MLIAAVPPLVVRWGADKLPSTAIVMNLTYEDQPPQDPDELVRSGAVRPSAVLTQVEELTGALDAYEHFDQREAGWHKVAFDPAVA